MFDDFPALREYLDTLDYQNTISPVDGVVYPGLNGEVPAEVRQRVRDIIGEPKLLFFRLSPEGREVPHQAHNDATMGNYTMIAYLNRQEHCQGGTSLLQHKEMGLYQGPVNEEQARMWERDTNNPEKWAIHKMYDMEENKAVLFDSQMFHRSEPVGSFGNVPRNARLVMVGFFDDVTPCEILRHNAVS